MYAAGIAGVLAVTGPKGLVYQAPQEIRTCEVGGVPVQNKSSYTLTAKSLVYTPPKLQPTVPFPLSAFSSVEAKVKKRKIVQSTTNLRVSRDKARFRKRVDFHPERIGFVKKDRFYINDKGKPYYVAASLEEGLEMLGALTLTAAKEEGFYYLDYIKQGCHYQFFLEVGIREEEHRVFLDPEPLDAFYDDPSTFENEQGHVHLHNLGLDERGALPVQMPSPTDYDTSLTFAYQAWQRGSRKPVHAIVVSSNGQTTMTPKISRAKVAAFMTHRGKVSPLKKDGGKKTFTERTRERFALYAEAQAHKYEKWIREERQWNPLLSEEDALIGLAREGDFKASYHYHNLPHMKYVHAMFRPLCEFYKVYSQNVRIRKDGKLIYAERTPEKMDAIADRMNAGLSELEDAIEAAEENTVVPEAFVRAYRRELEKARERAWTYTENLGMSFQEYVRSGKQGEDEAVVQ